MGECIITYNPSADKALGFNTLGELDFTDAEFKEFVRNNPLLFKEYIEKIAKENPIKFLTEKGKNIEFFTYENDNFILDESLYNEISNSTFLLNEIKERIKYKVTNYFNRKYMEE